MAHTSFVEQKTHKQITEVSRDLAQTAQTLEEFRQSWHEFSEKYRGQECAHCGKPLAGLIQDLDDHIGEALTLPEITTYLEKRAAESKTRTIVVGIGIPLGLPREMFEAFLKDMGIFPDAPPDESAWSTMGDTRKM